MMIIPHIKSIILRDLESLAAAINLYPESELLWRVLPGTANSAGNLSLHLIGNLRHFIGAVIGKTPYIRKREEEFGLKNLNKAELADLIAICKAEVDQALSNMDPADLEKEFPLEMSGRKSLTCYVLLHIITHFNYHLGQINYHRRYWTSIKTEL